MSTSQTIAGTYRQLAAPLSASLIGTTIEFFDFYIYATAAVIVFPKLFFPSSDPATAGCLPLRRHLESRSAAADHLAPFGHFGDRIGRKTTLVVALSTMGVSTVAIGALPTYATIGFAAPLLLALCRIFGQGLGLGGEWGGAVFGEIENAPKEARLVWHVSATRRAGRILFLAASSWCYPGGLAISNFSISDGVFRFWQAPCWCFWGSMCG